jgi:hypothetical protein
MRLTGVRSVLLLLPAFCFAQTQPTVGLIEIYGARTVPAAEIRKLLGVTEGKPLPKSKGDVEERLAIIDNVVAAHLEAACCEAGKAILYVGIEERGAPHFAYHPEPDKEEVVLPEPVVKSYGEFLVAARQAGSSGTATEDLSQGHSLLADEKARSVQTGFIALAEEHKDRLRKVLRESGDAEHRAIAAYVMGYAKDKASVHDDLQWAVRDPDETVRANALRALGAFAVYAYRNPELKLRVSPTWMIEMLNSLVWTDRNNAAVALVTLTEGRDPDVLARVRDRALPAVLEMARWKHLPHALPAFILAGRMAGVSEKALQEAWNKEDRESILKLAAKGEK